MSEDDQHMADSEEFKRGQGSPPSSDAAPPLPSLLPSGLALPHPHDGCCDTSQPGDVPLDGGVEHVANRHPVGQLPPHPTPPR